MVPVKLYDEQISIKCAYCDKDLLQDTNMSIVVIVENKDIGEIVDVYSCCKGECDQILAKTRARVNGSDGWKEMSTFTNPILFLQHIMAVMNNMHSGVKFTDHAFENYKQIILSAAPYVMRQPTEKELNRWDMEQMLPF